MTNMADQGAGQCVQQCEACDERDSNMHHLAADVRRQLRRAEARLAGHRCKRANDRPEDYDELQQAWR